MKCNISKERRELIEKAVGNISDRFVREVYEEDNPQTASGKRFVVPAWTRTLAASVCVVLAVGVFILSIPLVNGIITNRGMGNTPTDLPAAALTSAFENTDAQTGEQTAEQTKKEEAKSESMLIHSIKAGMYSADISELTAYPYISFSNNIIYYDVRWDIEGSSFASLKYIEHIDHLYPIQLLKVIDDSAVLAILHLDKDGKDVYAYVVFERESTPTRFPMKGAGTDETWRCRGKYYFVTESIASADIGLAVGDKVDSSVKERLGLFRCSFTADYQPDPDDLVQVADGIFIPKPEAEEKYAEVFREIGENEYTCVLTDGVMMIRERSKTHEVTSMTFYPWGGEMPAGFPISNGEDVIIFPITK